METPDLFGVLELYYDTAPRATARTEEVGPFTLFVQTAAQGWPFYARPTLGGGGSFTEIDIAAVRVRQQELEIPEAFEWVHETTPALLGTARAAGLEVAECPLLVLPSASTPIIDSTKTTVKVLEPDAEDLGEVQAAIHAGFAGTDEIAAQSDPGMLPQLMRDGLVVVVGAYDEHGVVGGGSHSPRGGTTELTGIAVLPRARRRGFGAAITYALVADARSRGVETVFLSAQDDAVARVYERVGFARVGTACIAEPADPEAERPVEIRAASGDDWERWREIRLRALQDAPDAYGSTYEREVALSEDHIRSRLGGEGPAFLALADDQPVALGAGFEDVDGWLLVVAMWVDPRWRRRGIGRLILDSVVRWGREHDLRVHLYVESGNAGARRLYEAYGFVATGETTSLRPGSDLTIELMALPLVG